MSPDATAEFARELMLQIWIPLRGDHLEDYYHADVIGHDGQSTLKLEDIRRQLASDRSVIASPLYDIQDLIAEDDAFSIRVNYSATHRETGESIRASIAHFYRLRAGKICEFWRFSNKL